MAMVQDQDPGRWVSWATRFLVYRQHIPTLLLVHKEGFREKGEGNGEEEETEREREKNRWRGRVKTHT